jgi:hypothetical protein
VPYFTVVLNIEIGEGVDRERVSQTIDRLRQKSSMLRDQYEEKCNTDRSATNSYGDEPYVKQITQEERTALKTIFNIELDIQLLEDYLNEKLGIGDAAEINLQRARLDLNRKKNALALEEQKLNAQMQQYERIKKLLE